MYEQLLMWGAAITLLLGCVTAVKVLFYTKSEVDSKIKDLQALSDKRDTDINDKVEIIKQSVRDELVEVKDKIFDKMLEQERANNEARQEFYERLQENKQIFTDNNAKMMEAISQLKQEQKEMSGNLLQFVNTIKDELKNDYINRYNDLLKVIGTKASLNDFDRLESKFDKLNESITELKTIVQLQREEQSKK